MFELAKFNPQSEIADVPVYEEPLRVESLVRANSVPPKATPEIVEFVSPALSSVPETVGVKVNAPDVGTIV